MTSNTDFARIASLSGDPARVGMLHALLDGRALTATELAGIAGVTPQTASGHLAKLTSAGLLAVEKQGRHRYYRIGTPAVATMLESIMQVAAELTPPTRKLVVGPKDAQMRKARTCYDHFAGQLGVAMTDALLREGHIEFSSDAGLLTEKGHGFLGELGIEVDQLAQSGTRRSGRVLCRPCLDWSERRPHVAGAVGALLCNHAFAQGWTRRGAQSRAVVITPKGSRALLEKFRIEIA